MMGDRSVLNSTATLACIGRRQKYFKDEFLSALEILHRGDLRPEQLRGSWAGAFGPTQFMPTAFKRFAVDADGDGRRDVVDNPADLIASTANNLKKDGWQPGQTWGYEVVLPKNFNFMLADRAKAMTLAQWEHLGLAPAAGRRFPRPSDKAYLLAPAGAEGPGFLMLQNFRVIMKYNPAEAYALAIGHFADRLRGGAPFVQPWPRQERVLSRAERLELQQLLAQRGFYRARPTASSAARPGRRCAASRPRSACRRTDLPPPTYWSGSGDGKTRLPATRSNLEHAHFRTGLDRSGRCPVYGGKSARLRPDSAIIAIAPDAIAIEPNVQAEILFPGVHRKRPLIALAVAIALLVGIVGPASAQFLISADHPGRRRAAAGGGWFGGDLFAPFQQPAPRAGRGLFQGAGAGEARSEHRAGAQLAGAGRRHGGLARLRS